MKNIYKIKVLILSAFLFAACTKGFEEINVDKNSALSNRYNVRSIPTFLFFKNGEVADKVVGAVPKAKLAEKLDALM